MDENIDENMNTNMGEQRGKEYQVPQQLTEALEQSDLRQPLQDSKMPVRFQAFVLGLATLKEMNSPAESNSSKQEWNSPKDCNPCHRRDK